MTRTSTRITSCLTSCTISAISTRPYTQTQNPNPLLWFLLKLYHGPFRHRTLCAHFPTTASPRLSIYWPVPPRLRVRVKLRVPRSDVALVSCDRPVSILLVHSRQPHRLSNCLFRDIVVLLHPSTTFVDLVHVLLTYDYGHVLRKPASLGSGRWLLPKRPFISHLYTPLAFNNTQALYVLDQYTSTIGCSLLPHQLGNREGLPHLEHLITEHPRSLAPVGTCRIH
ncbi:hypothetical protein BC834DRAFT_66168 [Gloeopeniophorella convolvens]|nr:hypothetical protein BC834DRAFT_66168 [Gloeopeniophorella convolvens]